MRLCDLISRVDVFKTRPQEILHLLYSMYVRIHRIPWGNRSPCKPPSISSGQTRELRTHEPFPVSFYYRLRLLKTKYKKKGKKCNRLTRKEKLEDQVTKERKKKEKKKDPMNSKAPFSNQVSSNSLAGITNIERTK